MSVRLCECEVEGQMPSNRGGENDLFPSLFHPLALSFFVAVCFSVCVRSLLLSQFAPLSVPPCTFLCPTLHLSLVCLTLRLSLVCLTLRLSLVCLTLRLSLPRVCRLSDSFSVCQVVELESPLLVGQVSSYTCLGQSQSNTCYTQSRSERQREVQSEAKRGAA